MSEGLGRCSTDSTEPSSFGFAAGAGTSSSSPCPGHDRHGRDANNLEDGAPLRILSGASVEAADSREAAGQSAVSAHGVGSPALAGEISAEKAAGTFLGSIEVSGGSKGRTSPNLELERAAAPSAEVRPACASEPSVGKAAEGSNISNRASPISGHSPPPRASDGLGRLGSHPDVGESHGQPLPITSLLEGPNGLAASAKAGAGMSEGLGRCSTDSTEPSSFGFAAGAGTSSSSPCPGHDRHGRDANNLEDGAPLRILSGASVEAADSREAAGQSAVSAHGVGSPALADEISAEKAAGAFSGSIEASGGSQGRTSPKLELERAAAPSAEAEQSWQQLMP
ncbi:unnamed protein product [Symbiodinium natans]|uniref:Uncharacterized protein n=1 Tax=Symbiodinium natans TaxID=878477 RepID=A0A812UVB6_9DINO|nr:unnamed protein product [Symbiodinium natans]